MKIKILFFIILTGCVIKIEQPTIHYSSNTNSSTQNKSEVTENQTIKPSFTISGKLK